MGLWRNAFDAITRAYSKAKMGLIKGYDHVLEALDLKTKEITREIKKEIDAPKTNNTQPTPIRKEDYSQPVNDFKEPNLEVQKGMIIVPFLLIKLIEKLPKRKLPKQENRGFQTPAAEPIAVATALQDHEFGTLLWNPSSDYAQKVETLNLQDIESRLDVATDKGLEKLVRATLSDRWQIWDRSAFVLPKTLAGMRGKTTLGVGLPYLHELAYIYREDSQRALMEIIDFIPARLDVKEKQLDPQDEEYSDLDFSANASELLDDAGLNIASMAGIGDIEKVLIPDKNPILNNVTKSEGFLGNLPPLFDNDRNEIENAKSDEEKILYWDNLTQTYKINSYVDVVIYLIQEFDALIGQFPISIEIEDSNLVEEGKQATEIKIANLSEGIAELYGLLTTNSLQTDVGLNILTRLIPEITRIRNLALTIYDVSNANQSFLGYRQKEEVKEVSSNFTLIGEITDEDGYSKLLQSSTEHIKTAHLADDAETLQEYLAKFIYTCGIVKAALSKKAEDLGIYTNKLLEKDLNSIDDFEEFIQSINKEDSFWNWFEQRSQVYYQNKTKQDKNLDDFRPNIL